MDDDRVRGGRREEEEEEEDLLLMTESWRLRVVRLLFVRLMALGVGRGASSSHSAEWIRWSEGMNTGDQETSRSVLSGGKEVRLALCGGLVWLSMLVCLLEGVGPNFGSWTVEAVQSLGLKGSDTSRAGGLVQSLGL